jgi:hypothetical protein
LKKILPGDSFLTLSPLRRFSRRRHRLAAGFGIGSILTASWQYGMKDAVALVSFSFRRHTGDSGDCDAPYRRVFSALA